MTTDTTTNHSERLHSRFGASAAYKFTVCTASIVGSEGIPSYSSEFAREGTAAHEVAQNCLETGKDAVSWLDKIVDGFTVSEDDWTIPLQTYLDECRKYMAPGWVWWIERPISLDKLNPPEEMFGTADFVAYNAKLQLLVVVDLKFGCGVGVKAEGNPQLKYYALGAFLGLPDDMHVKRIKGVIVQPRIPYGEPIKTTEFDPLELIEWSVWLLEKVNVCLSPDAEYVAGPHCKFCAKSGRCEEQAKQALSFAQDQFSLTTINEDTPPPKLIEPRLLTAHQIAGILNAKETVTAFFKAVEEVAKDGISRGWLSVPGWMLTESESKPKWSSTEDETVANKLKQNFNLTDDQVWTKKIVTFAQARNALKDELRKTGLKVKEAEEEAKKLLQPLLAPTVTTGAKLVPVASGKNHARIRGEEFPLLNAQT